jgi:hypothetical protein
VSAQESACAHFRLGTFQYLDSNEVVTIKRTAKRQVETSSISKTKTVFKIKWTSDCTYQITQIWSDKKEIRKYNGGRREVIITSADKDGYDFTCDCKTKEGIPPFGGRITKIFKKRSFIPHKASAI